MGNIVISPEQIRDLARQVNTEAADLDQTVQRLTNAFNSSSSFWQGNAQARFNDSMQQWNGSWRQMHQSLEEMQQLIQEWVQRAQELDDSVRLG